MKKTAYILLAAFMLFNFQCKKEKKVTKKGIINFMVGTVKIISAGKEKTAAVGDILEQGMKLQTAPKSFADIYFNENAIRVMADTIVEISILQHNLTKDTENAEFFLQKGKLFSRVREKLAKGDTYIIKTPTATAGVRGTEFMVSEKKGGGTNVAVLKGKLKVLNDMLNGTESVDLDKEQEVDVEKNKKMTVKKLSEDNRKELQNIIMNFQEMKQNLREQFEKERERIRQAVKDQKAKNKEMVQKQIETDKKNVEDQKETDKKNLEALKGTDTSKAKENAQKSISEQTEKSKSMLKNLKQPIKKFSPKLKDEGRSM